MTPGWFKPEGARKFHYADAEGVALCRRWRRQTPDFRTAPLVAELPRRTRPCAWCASMLEDSR